MICWGLGGSGGKSLRAEIAAQAVAVFAGIGGVEGVARDCLSQAAGCCR